jgi:serine/threonine protein kinase
VETEEGPAPVYPLAIGDLFSDIPEGGFDEETVKAIMFKLLGAVWHCHRLAIWHRDIKPENVLVMSQDISDVVLTDFGLSGKYPSGICREKDWPGSGPYMAPEMLRMVPYTERVDIWSLGVVMFVLKTGSYPFPPTVGQDQLSVIQGSLPHLMERNDLAGLSSLGKDLLHSMLQEMPVNRISARRALKHEWFGDPSNQSEGNGAIVCQKGLQIPTVIPFVYSAGLAKRASFSCRSSSLPLHSVIRPGTSSVSAHLSSES